MVRSSQVLADLQNNIILRITDLPTSRAAGSGEIDAKEFAAWITSQSTKRSHNGRRG
jgi:hypothetical protein